jgi:carboxypeptidase C (cathepsin A)
MTRFRGCLDTAVTVTLAFLSRKSAQKKPKLVWRRPLIIMVFLLVSSMIALPLSSEEELDKGKSDAKEQQKKEQCKEETKEETVVTSHSIKINGLNLSYKATAGNLLLRDEQGKPKAKIFYIAYTKDGEDLKTRPITFCFNGGPGSSSVWLHLGILGPKRIATDHGHIQQPYHLVDNEYSLLDITDLVFIDPVSTGYSRAVPGEDPKQFHGVDEDIKAVAEFILTYTTRNEQRLSPRFLAGESYGTTRAAGLADYLHDKHRMDLTGIILISSVLNFQTISFSQPGNELPYILYLPSYTAAAWYHKRLSPDLQNDFSKALSESKDFAINEYTQALMLGELLSGEKRQKIIEKLARYTGISPDYIEKTNLRINLFRFVKELLRDEKRTIGRFDSRFKGIDSDACGETFEFDPSLESIIGAFTATFNEYVRVNLNWKSDEEYKILVSVWPWNYGAATNQFLNVSEKLREVMSKNERLKVYVASGFYDLATPFFSTEYTFTHLGLDPLLRNHVVMKNYEGGHMIYLELSSLVKMKEDLSHFMEPLIPQNKESLQQTKMGNGT